MIPADSSSDPIRKQALAVLVDQFLAQGHPPAYASQMATAAIFQADLELRNAQLVQLLGWIKQDHPDLYTQAIAIIDSAREEFERRVQQ